MIQVIVQSALASDPAEAVFLRFQETCMDLLTYNVVGDFRNIMRSGERWASGCDWKNHEKVCYVHSRNDVIVDVRFEYLLFGDFTYQYAPGTLERLMIVGCNQRYMLVTRLLPRCALHVSFSMNYIHGPIDLATLPADLVTFYVDNNEMSGSLDFTLLPRSLETLSLTGNGIHFEGAVYDNLPEGLRNIDLYGTSVTRVQNIHGESDAVSGVFRGLEGSGERLVCAVC